MIDVNDKNALYNLLRLIREQGEDIRQLRLMVESLLWLVTRGDEDKMHEFSVRAYLLDQGRPTADVQRDDQWEAWLASVQHELEQGRAEIPS